MTRMNSNLTEDQRKDLAAMFLSKGWQLLKKELDERSKIKARRIIFGKSRETDDEDRGYIKAMESLVLLEKGIFASPEQEAPTIERPSTTDRYDGTV